MRIKFIKNVEILSPVGPGVFVFEKGDIFNVAFQTPGEEFYLYPKDLLPFGWIGLEMAHPLIEEGYCEFVDAD